MVPPRRVAQEKKDAEVLLRSPPQVTSRSLQSTLTFSPPQPRGPERPTVARPAATSRGSSGTSRSKGQQPHLQVPAARQKAGPRPRPSSESGLGLVQAEAARADSGTSSIAAQDDDVRGTPAMRYAARHAALSRVERILVHSYSSRDLAPPHSPNAFGAVPASLEDLAWAGGIEQRLAAASAASGSADVR